MKSLLHYTLIKKSLKWLSVSFFLLIVSTLAVYAQTYQPITVTGFNQDVVANGSGSPAASTTQAVDNNADVLYVKGYQCSPNSALGLPINGSFTSSANNSINYQFANYDANNALYLTSSSINTLNLAQPKQFVDLSFLAFSTEGSSTMTIKLNFTDGSFSGAYPFIVYDWYNGSSPAISSIGRINNGSGCLTDVFGLGAPYMYDHLIHLVGSDQQKLVQSITITNTNGTPAGNVSTNGRLLVMAVSGNAVNTPTSPLTIQSIAVTPETCAGLHNGTITVNYSNGAPPYHINLHVLSNNTFINNTPMTVTPISFFGLEPGTYEVNVGDLFGYQTRLVTINPGGTLATPVINNSTGTNVI